MFNRMLVFFVVALLTIGVWAPSYAQDPSSPSVAINLTPNGIAYESVWSPDGTRILVITQTANAKTAVIYDAQNGQPLLVLPRSDFFGKAVWGTEGNTVVITDAIATTEDVYDAATGALIEKRSPVPPTTLPTVGVYEDGSSYWQHRTTYVREVGDRFAGQTVFQVLYETATGRELARFETVRIDPNRFGGAAPEWNLTGDRVIIQNAAVDNATGAVLLQLPEGVTLAHWLADGQRLAFLNPNTQTFEIWNTGTGQPLITIPTAALDFTLNTDDSRVALLQTWGQVDVYDVLSGRAIGSNTHFNFIEAGAGIYVLPVWSPDGKRLALLNGPDRGVTLRVGYTAYVGLGIIVEGVSLTLYDSPATTANALVTLPENTALSLLSAPRDTPEGRWWEVQTTTGQRGWARETNDAGARVISARYNPNPTDLVAQSATLIVWTVP